MWITVKGINSAEIDDTVVRTVLNLYPEEKLDCRTAFSDAFNNGSIEFKSLKEESEKILIPWQMFFLTPANLDTQIKHIEEQRKDKVSQKLIVKRKGSGHITSKRIIDRLIRQQNFLIESTNFPNNTFAGSLKGKTVHKAVDHIIQYFEIDRNYFWSRSGKGKALEYLIKQIELKNINISRGVLTHKILPSWQVVPSNVYRNTSGFAIRDERIPFIFLPSEINPDEVESRQIYTLVYLLVIIGADEYDHILDIDFKAKMLTAKGLSARFHTITTEFLFPMAEADKIPSPITATIRDELSDKFKMSPTALVVTLKIRGIITAAEYKELKPPEFVPNAAKKKSKARSPKVSTSVRKFCGEKTYDAINKAIAQGTIKNIQAQYLIFGAVNKKTFFKYRKELGI